MNIVRLARLLLLFTIATLWPAAAQSWDSSGNGMLNGMYYFREVYYVVGYQDGSLSQALTLYNTVTFDGKGNYTMTNVAAVSPGGNMVVPTINGTYSISASGYGFLSNPASTTGDRIYGLVSQSGVFVGSSTESGFNDLFVAAPIGSTQATNATFKGVYTISHVDFSGSLYASQVGYEVGDMFQLNPDGAGNLGTVNIVGYEGGYGSSTGTQSNSGVKYNFSNGAATIAFPNNNSSTFIAGQEYLYISPDGNFIFGGSPTGFDFFAGVRMGSTAPTFGGLFYQVGMDENESNLSTAGYTLLDSYYGSFNAANGVILDHQRQSDVFFTNSTGYTFGDTYSLGAGGTYTSGAMKYAVGAGGAVRIGSGIGPYLGINVALAAPTPASAGSVYISPQGILNAASYAPFTAGISPGELITIYGSNLAASTQTTPGIPFATSVGGTQVNVNGLAAPIYYVSPGAISAIVPYAVGTSIANIQVINGGVLSNTVSEFINLSTPGVFTNPSDGLGYAAALHADYSAVTPQSPAQPGETISVYLTGLGTVNPVIQDGYAGPTATLSQATNTITADVSGATATVTYAGLAPQLAGLYQVNVTIPTGLTAGDNFLDISGPDSYTSEALISIGTGSTASAADSGATARSVAAARGAQPKALGQRAAGQRRPLPCLSVGGPCYGGPRY